MYNGLKRKYFTRERLNAARFLSGVARHSLGVRLVRASIGTEN